MRITIITFMSLLTLGQPAFSGNQDTPAPAQSSGVTVAQSKNVYREGTEWTKLWIRNADKTDKPHVLLVGDSITQKYSSGVAKALSGDAYVGNLTTSLCVCDPAFEPTLLSALAQLKFSIIHFNNGLHGINYTDEQYRIGYERIMKLIKEQQPQAKIIIALTTPLNPKSNKASRNPQVDARNALAKKLANSIHAEINDLHSPMVGHPEYYTDPFHYNGKGAGIQIKAVAESIRKLQGDKQALQ